MVTGRQPLIAGWLWPGLIAAGLLLTLALATLAALWLSAPSSPPLAFWKNRYLWHVLCFSFYQALFSTLLSILPAILLARSLYRRRFPGRNLLLRLCAMTLILPVLVAIFGILQVYGNQGWLSALLQFFGINWRFSPYGLTGILLAHVFFNLPMACRLLLQGLEQLPGEQRQMAAQLGLRGWTLFRFVEWPHLRQRLAPVSALIFMLCFASFTTVLTLGGGPKATTLELAIYQALTYDYNLALAAQLALVQMVCCLILALFCQHQARALPATHSHIRHWRDPHDSLFSKLYDGLLIIAMCLLIMPPLLAVIVSGLSGNLQQVLSQPALWQAIWTSLHIALAAGLLAVLLSMMLLWSSRELRLRQRLCAAQGLELSGLLILAMPGLVLAVGIFLLLNASGGVPQSANLIVIFINALMAIPYTLKVLEAPMLNLATRYQYLCPSLNLYGLQRLRWVELNALRQPLALALAYACVLSVGDFGVVALFGNENFRTLPFYLYQQIGAYRTADGAVTALVLLLFSFALFALLEKLPRYVNPH